MMNWRELVNGPDNSTPLGVYHNMLPIVEDSQSIVIICIRKDGSVHIGGKAYSSSELIGMLEKAKHDFLNNQLRILEVDKP